MKAIFPYLFIVILISMPVTTQAAQFSGEYLLKVCSLDKNGNEIVKGGKSACQSYISGVIDYHNTLRAMNLTSNMNFCIPEDVTLNELQIRVLAYMYKRTKMHRNFVAAPGVAMALFSSYPCNKKKKKKYIATILGIASNKGDLLRYVFMDRTAYSMALFVVLWVSGPAIIWILLRGSALFYHVADVWYKIMAALMVVTIGLSFVLFPEASMLGMRFYFVMSVPVFVLIYIFLVRGGLPPVAAYPLNALGVCTLIYGGCSAKITGAVILPSLKSSPISLPNLT